MKNFITVLFGVLIFISCENALDVSPQDRISDDQVWEDPALIEGFLNDIYRGLGSGLAQGKLSALTSNASTIPVHIGQSVVQSAITPGDRGLFANQRGDILHYEWENLYEKIRHVNILLSEIENSAIQDQEIKDRITGEAHFLRAYFYHNLMRAYGGVPIITEPYGLDDEDFTIARNSFEETVYFIVQEAEEAESLLPLIQDGSNQGRATRGAVLALKARVLLFAASDLYHDNPSGMPETGYTNNQDRSQMWRAAKNAAQEIMDLGIYSLYRGNPAPSDSVAQNYYNLFRTYGTDEAIFERYWAEGEGSDFLTTRDIGPNTYHGPNGYHQWAGNTPTQQLVDAYKMGDGSDFSWNNSEHASDPYENRDPRFYGTILYDGASWFDRPSDATQFDRDNVIQTFQSVELPSGSTVPGVDTRDSPVEPWNGTYSGYYMRKFISEEQAPPYAQSSVWMYFRYAEILLNYAEASIELGEYGDARDALNSIRQRVNMPEIASTVSGEELEEAYRNERRIELVFEEHRFFDIRRWMIAPDVMNEDARGINITAEATDRADRSTYFNYEYEVMNYQERFWDDKLYFVPISQDEMNRNNELVQNPGY